MPNSYTFYVNVMYKLTIDEVCGVVSLIAINHISFSDLIWEVHSWKCKGSSKIKI